MVWNLTFPKLGNFFEFLHFLTFLDIFYQVDFQLKIWLTQMGVLLPVSAEFLLLWSERSACASSSILGGHYWSERSEILDGLLTHTNIRMPTSFLLDKGKLLRIAWNGEKIDPLDTCGERFSLMLMWGSRFLDLGGRTTIIVSGNLTYLQSLVSLIYLLAVIFLPEGVVVGFRNFARAPS